MVKQKTRKAAAKRFTVGKRGKVLRRYTMQDHFNVGRSKKVIRSRRRDRTISHADRKRLTRMLPFNAPPSL
jgi:large subunit ribosomal protein L35